MTHHTNLDDKLEGANNFQAWKYRISLVLEENVLDKYISEEVHAPEGDEAKAIDKKTWSSPRELLQILLKIISSLVCHP